MSENHDSELLEGGSGSAELSFSEPVLVPIQSSESSDGFTHVEASTNAIHSDDNQEFVEGSSRGDDEDEAKIAEDAGKEDLFVDCPDELVGNADGKEAVVSTEMEENSEEKLSLEETYGGQDGFAATGDEVERLRAKLDKALREKERVSHDHEEEREGFARELAKLRHQLKALANGESLLLGGSGGEEENGTGVSLNELMNESSRIVQSAYEERLATEAKIRELHDVILAKDQEIEVLNAKVKEFPGSDVEMVTDRLLAYFTGVVGQQEQLDDSIGGKLVFIERGAYMLGERYNMIFYEVDQLRQCFSEARLDAGLQDLGTFFTVARSELVELKRRELEFAEKLSHLEEENRKLVKQLDEQRAVVERVNVEIGKTKAELEQEKVRSSNTKEKLTMAVTKGKALVQQRESLKQSLAEKTSELEKFLVELQEKSSALEAAESHKEELFRSENLVVSLQETLFQRNAAIEKIEEMFSESGMPDELQSMEIIQRCRWLIDENDKLKGISIEFDKVRDALSLIHVPETVSSFVLESQVHWIRDSLHQAKSELDAMQDEIATTREAAQKEIDRLTASLSAELQTKDHLQTELDDLTCKYREIVEKEHRVSLEKDHIVKMLLEASGIAMDDEVVSQLSSDDVTLVERCCAEMKEHSSVSSTSSYVDAELFEKVQSYLYVRSQELVLCELVLQEEMLMRSQVINLSNEMRMVSQELAAVKEEEESLQKDLERSEEKSALLREKLSMAVKKGKGLVQDRENLKLQLDEKKSEIEKLKLQLKQQESELADHRERISSLSVDIERIPKLEMDLAVIKEERDHLAAIKEERDQLEKFLLESNNMLQRVIGSIDKIDLPVDSVFEEPVEKVSLLAEYINECRDGKTLVEEEMVRVKEEANTLYRKLVEAEASIKSLEDALSVAENEFSRLAEEKGEIEVAKDNVEKELEKVREEVSLHSSKYVEVSESKRSTEEALSLAENNMLAIISEKESALVSRDAAESELEQVKEEVAIQTSKLTEAYKTIQSLEDALSEARNNVNVLNEQNSDVEVQRTNLENELKKLQEEAGSQVSKLADATATIKSLEDALLKAENSVSVLEGEKKNAEEEILTLSLKLKASMEELAGTNGSLESRSTELSGYLCDLQVLMNDSTLLSLLKGFEKKFDSLKNMDDIIGHIKDRFLGLGLEDIEEDFRPTKSITDSLDDTFNFEKENGEVSVADGDHVSSFGKTVEGFRLRNKILAERFERFSLFIDEFIAALLRKLQATKEEVVVVFEHIETLKQKVNSLEVYKQEQGNTITLLENDVMTLLDACTNATRELQFEVKNNLLELSSVPQLEKLRTTLSSGEINGVPSQDAEPVIEGSKCGKVAEMLLLASRKVKALCEQFESTTDVAASTIVDLQNSLKEAGTRYEKALEESDLKQNMVSKLEGEVKALQNSCGELRLSIEDYQAKEVKLKEREAEVEALKNSCSELRLLMEEYQAEEIKLKEREAEVEALQNLSSELRLSIEDYQAKEVRLKEREAEVQALQNSCSELRLLIEELQAKEVKSKEREAEVEELQNTCSELRLIVEEYQAKEVKLKEREAEVEALKSSCSEMRLMIEDYQAKEVKLKEREAEVSSLYNSLLMKEQESEDCLLSASQVKNLFDKIREIEIPMAESEVGDVEPHNSTHVKKLFYIIDNVTDLQHQINSLYGEKEKLQSTLGMQTREIQLLKEEIEQHFRDKQATEKMKNELPELVHGLEKIIAMLGGDSFVGDQNSAGVKGPLSVLERQVMSLLMEYESSKSKAQDLSSKLVGSQKIVDELSTKVKLLEDSIQGRSAQPEILHERSLFEAPSLPTGPEISEIEDAEPVGKSTISPVPSAAHVRTMRKGSTDHLSLDIDLESNRLINREETDEDKGHVFKSLNTSGLVPKQGKSIADRIDGIWVSGGRVLMSRPRARLGVIAYSLLLHIWLLATIL
ncbi:hypothetical protein L484_027619 [Morus notabilis]|uniref:Uncharacterized protein n=1 Tax=Morus notabilis TaxID=981085 RepID=W9RKG9_9ROSA|nr:myosin-3 [Morus notabilis]EXB82445.1 hypothetical protein L484_027619 [Morus notabilis]